MKVLIPLFFIAVSAVADWRTDALERIDTHRKANLSILIQTEDGTPVKDAEVSVQLKRHSFPFGAVVRSSLMQNSPNLDLHKENYLKYFNAAGEDLGLKPKWWGTNNESVVEPLHAWFIENDFNYRGHALIWEGEGFLPSDQLEIYNSTTMTDQEKGDTLVKMMEAYMHHALEKWDVTCWDVINEPVVNNIVNELLPEFNTFAHWFKLADSLRTVYNREEVQLVLNENQIISQNANYSAYKPDSFMTIIDSMLIDSAPIEMLGFQSRIKNGMIPADTLYQRLVNFEKYNLPYQATEFEIRSGSGYTYTDEEIRQQTEEFLLTYFSHPSVEGIWHWTFLDMADGSWPWALFTYDGTPTPTGEKWIELMEGVLNTDTTMVPDSNGESTVRGYFGSYEIHITYKDSTFIQPVELTSDVSMRLTFSEQTTPVVQQVNKKHTVPFSLTKSGLNITKIHPYQLDIFTANGKRVRTISGTAGRVELNSLGLASGVYQLRVVQEADQFTSGFIIQ